MTEEEREAREALEHFHAELQRIEAEYRARMAANNRKFRRFMLTWWIAMGLWLLNLFTINEPVINYLFQIANIAWGIQAALDWRRLTKDQRS